MAELVYRLRFAWHLYCFTDLTLREALAYPRPQRRCAGRDPIEDAEAEIDLFGEG